MKSIKKQLIELVQDLQSQQESSELEFKKAEGNLPESFWETYSSFANTEGGYILLGVSEKPWEISGVKNPNKMLSDLCNSANNKDTVSYNLVENKYLQIHEIDGKKIISVYIPEVEEARKPVYLKGNPLNAYIRKHEGDYKISEDDLKRFGRNAQQALDGELLEDYILEDLNMESVLAFKNHLHGRNPSKNYLVFPAFTLDEGTASEMGGISVTMDDAEETSVEGASEKEAESDTEDSSGVESSLNKDTDEQKNINDETSSGLEYTGEGYKVTVEDLYYTFANPGKMLVTESQFFMGGVTRPRNTTLIGFFRNMGISDRAGTGGATLLNFAVANRFRAPEIMTSLSGTALKLWIAAPLESHPEFDEKEKMIYEFIFKSQGGVSVPELEAATGLNSYQVRKVLASLTESGLLTKIGRARATRYVCTPSIVERKDIADKLRRSLLEIE